MATGEKTSQTKPEDVSQKRKKMSLKLVNEDSNVTPIMGAQKPNDLVVEVLEAALADAKSGKLQGIILITQEVSGTALQRTGELIAPNVFALLDQFRFSYMFDQLLTNRGAP